MAIPRLKKGIFSGVSKIFDGTLEKILNSIIDTVNGGPVAGGSTQLASLTAITTPDATDGATAADLANANKAKINEIIAALKA